MQKNTILTKNENKDDFLKKFPFFNNVKMDGHPIFQLW